MGSCLLILSVFCWWWRESTRAHGTFIMRQHLITDIFVFHDLGPSPGLPNLPYKLLRASTPVSFQEFVKREGESWWTKVFIILLPLVSGSLQEMKGIACPLWRDRWACSWFLYEHLLEEPDNHLFFPCPVRLLDGNKRFLCVSVVCSREVKGHGKICSYPVSSQDYEIPSERLETDTTLGP